MILDIFVENKKSSVKGAVCSLGAEMLMSREKSSLADFFLNKHTK